MPAPLIRLQRGNIPDMRAFHADVKLGSTCHEAPDRAGPITSQRNEGRLSPDTTHASSYSTSGQLHVTVGDVAGHQIKSSANQHIYWVHMPTKHFKCMGHDMMA
eukprot:jgi/Chrzof1/324/Cz01g11130.t1